MAFSGPTTAMMDPLETHRGLTSLEVRGEMKREGDRHMHHTSYLSTVALTLVNEAYRLHSKNLLLPGCGMIQVIASL